MKGLKMRAPIFSPKLLPAHKNFRHKSEETVARLCRQPRDLSSRVEDHGAKKG